MIEAGAPHTIGPNLWGVVGRPVASAEGYDRYTPGMSSLGGAWTPARLDIYLRQPMVEVQGTTMAFPGGTPDDLIAWLNRLGRSISEPVGAWLNRNSRRLRSTSERGRGGDPRLLRRLPLGRARARRGFAGGTAIEEPDRTRVLGYLATHYGIDRPNFPH